MQFSRSTERIFPSATNSEASSVTHVIPQVTDVIPDNNDDDDDEIEVKDFRNFKVTR